MKYEIANSNNLIALAGRIGKITPKFDSLTNVSIAHKPSKEETEWLYLNFSNPNNNFNGVDWADFANTKLKVGDMLLAVCYMKQNGQYTNYYVNLANNENLYSKIANTKQYAIVGKVAKIDKKSDTLYNITIHAANKDIEVVFMDRDNFKPARFAAYLEVGEIVGCITTKVDKDDKTTYYANAFEYGSKEKKS